MIILQYNAGKYAEVMYDSTAGGWVLADDVTPAVAPPYTIGSGFFFFNPKSTPGAWAQSLP